MACGIPLVSAPWQDCEHLFDEGRDYLMAKDGDHMTELLRLVLADKPAADRLSQNALSNIRARHTCAHRLDELLGICSQLKNEVAAGGAH
jgi:spore maturation protein CgeB